MRHNGLGTKPIVRVRRHDDIDACVRVLGEVHAADGYPMHWPADPHRWPAPRGLLMACVAECEGTVAGHVALCNAAGDGGAFLWSAAYGIPEEQIAEVTRLFVSPDV